MEKAKKGLQSSCKYANPFAAPRAIFSLVGQSMVGRPLPAMTNFKSAIKLMQAFN